MNSPVRGEIWWADLEPTRGQEINKKRPVVVLSSDDVGVLAIKLIAPITGRPPSRSNQPWLVQVRPTKDNGLTKDGCVDVLQLRGTFDSLRQCLRGSRTLALMARPACRATTR